MNFTKSTVCVLFAITIAMTNTRSQSSLYEYGNSRYVRLELNKPIFSESEDLGFFNLANYLTVQFSASNKIAIVAELPFAFSSIDKESKFAIGNLGIGLNYFGSNGNLRVNSTLLCLSPVTMTQR